MTCDPHDFVWFSRIYKAVSADCSARAFIFCGYMDMKRLTDQWYWKLLVCVLYWCARAPFLCYGECSERNTTKETGLGPQWACVKSDCQKATGLQKRRRNRHKLLLTFDIQLLIISRIYAVAMFYTVVTRTCWFRLVFT